MVSFEPRPDIYRYIVSVDIGIHHLALTLVETLHDYTLHDLVWFELIDITRFVHLDPTSRHTCALSHTRTASDWLAHVFFLYHELFQLADHILIERQPPGGQIAIEQLFFFHFRSKAVLIHPNAVHAFFGWRVETDDAEIRYQHRKEKSLQVLQYRLAQTPRTWLRDMLQEFSRQHDIADAYCQIVFFAYQKHLETRRRNPSVVLEADLHLTLERFRFKLEIGM